LFGKSLILPELVFEGVEHGFHGFVGIRPLSKGCESFGSLYKLVFDNVYVKCFVLFLVETALSGGDGALKFESMLLLIFCHGLSFVFPHVFELVQLSLSDLILLSNCDLVI